MTKQSTAARRRAFDAEEHARKAIEAIEAVDADGLREEIMAVYPNLTANEADDLVVATAIAIHANETRGKKTMDTTAKELDEGDAPRPFWELLAIAAVAGIGIFCCARSAT
jgi:hypothetical protein